MNDLNGYAPILEAMESWRDAGVLDAPAHIKALQQEVRSLKALIEGQKQLVEMAMEFVGKAATRDVQFKMPDKVDLDIGKVEHQTQVIVPVEELAKALGAIFVPVFKALAERPVSEVHYVEKALPAPVVEHVHHEAPVVNVPPAQVEVNLVPLAEAIESQGKALKKLAESMKPTDLTPVLKVMAEQNERIDKALGKLGERPAPKQKTLQPRYDGGWDIVETDDAANG